MRLDYVTVVLCHNLYSQIYQSRSEGGFASMPEGTNDMLCFLRTAAHMVGHIKVELKARDQGW